MPSPTPYRLIAEQIKQHDGQAEAGPLDPESWLARAELCRINPNLPLGHLYESGPARELSDTFTLETRYPDNTIKTQSQVAPEILIAHKTPGFRLSLFGPLTTWPSPYNPAYSRPPWPFAHTPFTLPDIPAIVTIQLRIVHGWFDDSIIFAEMIWKGQGIPGWTIECLGYPVSDEELRKGEATLKRLQLYVPHPGGRPMLSGHWRTPESFRAEVDPLIKQLRADGKGEGREHVASYMPAAAWRQHDRPVSLQARVRRLERAAKKLLNMTWDEYVRTVE